MAAAIRSVNFPSNKPVVTLISSWILMIPLLVFASQWGFSFEHGSLNSALGSQAGETGESLPLKIQSAIVYLICSLFILRLWRFIFSDFCSDLLISSLPALAFLSIAWSQYPMVTLVHAILLTLNIAFAYYLLERFSTSDFLEIAMMAGTIAVISSLLVIAFLPRFGIQERDSLTSGSWQGIFPQKNICGFMMINLLLPSLFARMKSRLAGFFRGVYVVAVLGLIAMSRSTGAWVDCVATLAFVFCLKIAVRMPRKQVGAILFPVAGIAILGAVLIFENFDTLMYALGKDPTLTGRTALWSLLITSVMKRPLLGYGYTAFWGLTLEGESANAQIAMHWRMGYAENGVLQLWLDLGAVGVTLYALVFFRAIKDAIACFMKKPSPEVMWYLTSLFFIAVSNIASGKLLATSDLGLIFSLIVFAGLRREAREARTKSIYRVKSHQLAMSGT